ncbi:MAG: flagellin [Pseudorhodobacter sp.]|nr:flagellin [Pseudorhodobacter sp.]
MPLTSIGDLSQHFITKHRVTALKLQSQTAGTELTTGVTADLGSHLRGGLGQISAIEGSLGKLAAYRSATQNAEQVTTAMQGVFDLLDRLTGNLATALLDAGTLGQTGTADSVLGDARHRFDASITALNSRHGGISLFAGTRTDGSALTEGETILDSLRVAINTAGATSASEIETVIDDWFSQPNGFATVAYAGGDSIGKRPISQTDQTTLNITAQDPALRNTLKPLAMAALLADGLPVASADRNQLIRRSGEALFESQSQRALLSGRLGMEQARIEEAATQNEAERSSLQMARSALLAVDPYEAATRLEDSQNQLETLYAVTARLSRLTLLDFLR